VDVHQHADCDADREPIGGGFWSGVTHVAKSPYLLGICAFMLLHTITSTLVYFQQADITAHADLVQICG
jgi:AAA family ATP:ADP antiporter